MSATRDWMWRTNSCSTASRSSRIGSKICARSAETADFCAVSLKGMCRVWLPVVSQYWSSARGVNALSRLMRNSWTKARHQQCSSKLRGRACAAERRRPATPATAGERLDHSADKRRLVALPAVRDRRQIRRVGLDEQAIGGHERRATSRSVVGARETSRCRQTTCRSRDRAPARAIAASPVKQ